MPSVKRESNQQSGISQVLARHQNTLLVGIMEEGIDSGMNSCQNRHQIDLFTLTLCDKSWY